MSQLVEAVRALTPQSDREHFALASGSGSAALTVTPLVLEELATEAITTFPCMLEELVSGESCEPCQPRAKGVPVSDDAAVCLAFGVADDATAASAGLPSEWIQTTHVGSLPRSTGSELHAAEIILLQRKAGLHVINDGEWSRENYIGDMLSRIDGVGSKATQTASGGPGCLCEMPCASDMLAVPTYARRFTGSNGLITLNPKRVARGDMACTATPTYLGTATLKKTLAPFLAALDDAGVPRITAFWSVPSPGTLALFCEDRCFGGDHERYVRALAEAVRPEYEAIAASGIMLQVDCPDLAMGRHTRYINLTDDEFAAVARANVVALNYSLSSIPASRVRIHVCWGNYAGPHHLDVAAYSVWPHVAEVHAKYVLLEGANPRHGHEVAAFEQAVSSGLIGPDTVVVPGVIDTTAARVEHPALIAERLLRFVKAAGHPSRVMASTDCGFASTARSVAITADLAWRKIEALVEGAALATRMCALHPLPALPLHPFHPLPAQPLHPSHPLPALPLHPVHAHPHPSQLALGVRSTPAASQPPSPPFSPTSTPIAARLQTNYYARTTPAQLYGGSGTCAHAFTDAHADSVPCGAPARPRLYARVVTCGPRPCCSSRALRHHCLLIARRAERDWSYGGGGLLRLQRASVSGRLPDSSHRHWRHASRTRVGARRRQDDGVPPSC